MGQCQYTSEDAREAYKICRNFLMKRPDDVNTTDSGLNHTGHSEEQDGRSYENGDGEDILIYMQSFNLKHAKATLQQVRETFRALAE